MEEVDSAEFSRWMALDRERPFDETRWLLLQLTTLLANVHRGERQDAWTMGNFDLFAPEPPETEDEKRERIAASVRRAFEANNVVMQRNEGRGN